MEESAMKKKDLNRTTTNLTFSMPIEQALELGDYLKTHHMTRSEYLRSCIRRDLEKADSLKLDSTR